MPMAPGTISLRLFGGASLERDGQALSGPPAQRHRLALMALLCVSHPLPLSRPKLMGYLWPERDERHARQLLNQALHILRKTLGDGAIVSAGDELRLGAPPIECDVHGFEDALAEGDTARAADLYAGPLMDAFFLDDAPEFERWLDHERERLRRDWRRALGGLAEERLAAGDAEAAAECSRRLLADDPYDARATVGLMEALESLGDRAGAIRQARLHEALIEEEFGADPDPAVRALAERIRAGEVREASAGREAGETGAVDQGEVASPAAAAGGENGGVEVAAVQVDGASVAPRRSWRWTGGVATALAALAMVAWVSTRALSRADAELTRIAVLPLANLTGDSLQDYFVAGMHDALISELAKVGALTVYSRQSVLRYEDSDRPLPEIAGELGVDALVEGAVFKSGDSVRISVQLVRAEPERHLFSETFTGPLNRALALQGTVARAVADATRATVTPDVRARLASSRAVDPAAQEAYLTGLYHLEHAIYGQARPTVERDAEIQVAIGKLEEAVALDSTWASAWAKLALARHFLATAPATPGTERDESFRKSKAAALRAIELDPDESQAWASLGFVLLYHEWDWEGAERAILRANELDPNSHHWTYAIFLESVGRQEEAIVEFRRALERNPASDIVKSQVATAYACAEQYDQAIAEARELHARVAAAGTIGAPGDSIWFLSRMARYHSLAGDHDEAIDAARRLVTVADALPDPSLDPLQFLAFALAMGGRHDEARSVIAELGPDWAQGAGGWQAPVFAALGDTDRAVSAVATLMEALGRPRQITCWEGYKLLRDEPSFRELLKSWGYSI
jgi:DNA-binding SARP family transcriptional activator/TolB-like protein